MKAKHCAILALVTGLAMIASMLPAITNEPVSASPAVLKWTRITTPGSVYDKNDIVSPCEVNRIAIGSDGKTFYAVDIANPGIIGSKTLYKSVDGGISWNEKISINLYQEMTPAEQINFRLWNVAIAPDNVNFLAVVTNDDTTQWPRNVWVSTNGGAKWENTNCPATSNISAICISPNGSGHDITVGTRTGIGTGNVYIFKASAQDAWAAQGFSGDILATKFSPTYASDSTLVVTSSNNSGTYLNIGLHDKVANTTNWGTWGPVEITTAGANTSPKFHQVITADLKLPSDFSGQAPSLRRCYISIDDAGVTGNAGIYRFDDTTGYWLMAATPTKRISSIAYYGTFASGKLLAGEVRGDSCSATVMTWFTDSPTTCPIPCWYPAMKPPTGAAGNPSSGYGNAQVAWSPDGAIAYIGTASSAVLIPGADWPNPYLEGKDLDESAFSLSRNNGETWNQLALIDTKIDQFIDIAPSPDCSTVYLASVNKNDGCRGFDSVWRSSSNTDVVSPLPALLLGTFWERILCQPTTSQTCATTQTDNAILGLAGDKADGQLVFWAAVGTKKIMWSPDFGDYWTSISPSLVIQDIAVEDSKTLYILSPDGWMQKFAFSGVDWVSGSSVSTELDTGYSIATAYTGLTPDNDKGHVIVAGNGTGGYDVAYSTDGGVSFTPITTQLPTRGKTLVIAHSGYKKGGNIFAINSGGMYEWSVYYGGGTWAWPLPEFGKWSTQWGGPSWPTAVTGLTISRNGSFYFSDHIPFWKDTAYIRWSSAYAGIDPAISLGTEPTRRLRICGGMASGEPINVWLIDQQSYNPPQGGVWCYTDTLLWTGPTPVEPVSQAAVDCDPVSGRAGEINLRWKPVSLSRGYRIEIAKDEDFALKVAYIGGYCRTSNLVQPQETICTGWSVPFYVPHDLDAPALVIPPGGGKVIDANGNSWTVPALEAGHTYYWRIAVQDVATGDSIWSPSSWREMFIVKTGIPAGTPYYGLQLLSPDNGCLGCPVKPASFSWSLFQGATKYKFILAKDSAMSDIIVEADVPATAYTYEGTLDYNSNYFWQVKAIEPSPSDWSATFCFQTEAAPIPQAPQKIQVIPLWIGVVIAIGVLLDISLFVLLFRRWST